MLLTSVAFFAAARSLARRRVLVQQLAAVEGLARVDVMCVDKTGTLTQLELPSAVATAAFLGLGVGAAALVELGTRAAGRLAASRAAP